MFRVPPFVRRSIVAGVVVPPAAPPAAGLLGKWLSGVGLLDNVGNPSTDGAVVTTWQDQSGNANHMLHAGTNAPVRRDAQAAFNNLTAVQSNSNTSRLKTGTILMTAECTLAVVVRWQGAGSSYPHLMTWGEPAGPGGSLGYNLRHDNLEKPGAEQNGGAVLYGTTPGTTNYAHFIGRFITAGSLVQFWRNGVSVGTAARGAYAGATQALSLFSAPISPYNYKGYIAEAWAWSVAITNAQITDTISYFNTKFGTPIDF
jgi:hypothetical protein